MNVQDNVERLLFCFAYVMIYLWKMLTIIYLFLFCHFFWKISSFACIAIAKFTIYVI